MKPIVDSAERVIYKTTLRESLCQKQIRTTSHQDPLGSYLSQPGQTLTNQRDSFLRFPKLSSRPPDYHSGPLTEKREPMFVGNGHCVHCGPFRASGLSEKAAQFAFGRLGHRHFVGVST